MTRERGFNLLELLIALTIGLTLIAAFLVVLQRARRDFSGGESLARLQDSARHALGVIASDIEHAGFFGFMNGERVQLVRDGVALADTGALVQPTAEISVPPVTGVPAGTHDCGVNFAVDLRRTVQGSDNRFALGIAARDCAPTAAAGGARESADTLTLRYASLGRSTPRAGRLQLYSAALSSQSALLLFADGRAPGPVDDGHEVRDLEVRTYYVANDSVERRGWPALRVKSLTESRGAAHFRDEELMPGVEDLQVEYVVEALESGRRLLRVVNAESPSLRTGRVIAVRLWLRIRSDVIEDGFRDARAWNYANVSFMPSAAESRQRRLVLSRTVALRNLRES
jgi:type IV pilus assembly protein PilW